MNHRTCSECGGPLTSLGAAEGICSRCLVRLAIGAETATEPARDFSLPLVIGPYRLIEKIGEGGMGVVYRAEQKEPVRRTVAIKLVRRDADPSQVLARFEAERQALALMEHPGIARIHDAGTMDDGRPYFAMEYVAGEPITDYCDRRKLATKERLDLFLQVCDAVQHAHHKGVVHRDLKPANVLVTERDQHPSVRIIDFGIAKATQHKLTSRTLVTQLGLAIGTPEYMSPEQASGTGLDVDTRTDVYSLGVLLYELLVGALPFDPAELREVALDEVLRRIREEDPPRPSLRLTTLGEGAAGPAACRDTDVRGLSRELQGDLDWIVMRTLEKDRNRRYGSPAELVADVRRHLANEPVQAGPPSAAYRVRKFVRRHRLGVAVAATVLLALVATTAGTSYGLFRALAAEREARENAATAERVSDFLVGLFEVTDPNIRQGSDLSAREVFDAGAERVDSELAGEPLLRARMLRTFGAVYLNLGLMDDAERNLRKAMQIEEELRSDLAQARTAEVLAHTLFQRGDDEEAERIATRAIELWSDIGIDDDPALAQAHIVLGYIDLYHREVPEEAEPHLKRALEVLTSNPRSKPATILTVRGSLAAIPWYRGDVEGFVEGAREAVEYARANGIDDTVAATVMERWTGHAPWLEGRLEEAERINRRVLERQLTLIGGESTQTLDTRWDLSSVMAAQGRYNDVARLGVELITACERLLGPNDPETVAAMALRAEALRRTGRTPEAVTLFEQVRTRAIQAGQSEAETHAVVDCYVALAERDAGPGLIEMLSTCARSLAPTETSRTPDSARLSLPHRARLDLAQVAAAHGDPDLAVRILEGLIDGGYRDPLLHRRGFAALEDHPDFEALLRRSSSAL